MILEIIFLPFWSFGDFQDQGASTVSFLWQLSSGLPDSHLAVSSRDREKASSLVSLLRGTNSIMRTHLRDLIQPSTLSTSPKPRFQIPSHWELGLPPRTFMGMQTFGPQQEDFGFSWGQIYPSYSWRFLASVVCLALRGLSRQRSISRLYTLSS